MTASETVDVVVIGAGVVGLAVARALALAGREVLVLEQARGIGTETSSRNSEVIHAGIYYAPGSLKAHLCVAGKAQLYRYCAERGIGAVAIGKLLVATSEDQMPHLAALKATAEQNGVGDLRWLTPAEAQAMEPELACTGALLSPSSGVVDSHGYMLALQGDLEHTGGIVVLETPVVGGVLTARGVTVETGGADAMRLHARLVVNAAGLHAPSLAHRMTGLPAQTIPTPYFAKGTYFALGGVRSPFSRLIYPMPEQGGLGIHATVDLGGQTRFGPDVEWVNDLDYAVDPARAAQFYAAIRRYWPALPDGALSATYSGIRPKLVPKGQPAADFRIDLHACRDGAGLISLFGIESPGLTASLAIANRVAAGGAYARQSEKGRV